MPAMPPAATPVDLRADGVLFMVNRQVFHPRGFALAVDPATGDLSLLGDGTEPWCFAPEPDNDVLFRAFEALLDRARCPVVEVWECDRPDVPYAVVEQEWRDSGRTRVIRAVELAPDDTPDE